MCKWCHDRNARWVISYKLTIYSTVSLLFMFIPLEIHLVSKSCFLLFFLLCFFWSICLFSVISFNFTFFLHSNIIIQSCIQSKLSYVHFTMFCDVVVWCLNVFPYRLWALHETPQNKPHCLRISVQSWVTWFLSSSSNWWCDNTCENSKSW